MNKNNLLFRAWYYFRMGWSTYFAFILAAINTLTVTYFLAIDNYPSLKSVFPSFETYIVLVVSIGIPLLISIGYAHFKKTQAFKTEIEILVESNPFLRRTIVNTENTLRLNLLLAHNLVTQLKNKTIDEKDIEKLENLIKELDQLSNARTFRNSNDMDYLIKELGLKK
tara:strand:- start:214 stop:717 length:504 start_codon:yes stop_codon:yes gene_type:complete